ncbi:MAG TPA: VOC family protein [Thermoplasmata archaeon]|nr:VOC family protein [Thermoplasmata archaeon]
MFRRGGLSYLDIPSSDPHGSAQFYHEVFGWTIGERPGAWAFEDGTGHVIGHFVNNRPIAGGAGVLPYVFVGSLDAALARAVAAHGTIRREPFPVGELLVAVVEDPSGTAVGIWQRGHRRHTPNR